MTPVENRSGRGLAVGTMLAAALAVGGIIVDAGPSAPPPTVMVASAAEPSAQLELGGPALLPVAGAPGQPPAPVPVAELRPAAFTSALPDDRARIAIAAAMAQIGLPYVWGGDGPAAGDAGFDCSGLTTFAYTAAGVILPRTAHTQYYAGPHVPAGAPLQPGDLAFYGTPAKVHHVGMYIGAGRMVSAPTFGKPVRTAYYRWTDDDYLGATRPAATGQPTTGLLPYLPPPPVTAPSASAAPPVFEAPPAPLPSTPLPSPTDPQPPEADTAAAAIAATDSTVGAGPQSDTAVVPATTAAPSPQPGTPSTTSPSATTQPTPPSSSAGASSTTPSAPPATTPSEPAATSPVTTPTTTPAPAERTPTTLADSTVPLSARDNEAHEPPRAAASGTATAAQPSG